MNYDPVPYKKFDREPLGVFSAEMLTDGWKNTKFDHALEEHLLSAEVAEFMKLIHHLFYGVCKEWRDLQKFASKYGTEIQGEDYNMIRAFNYEGDVLDFIVHIDQTSLKIFPYRKFKHKNIGRYE